MLFTKINLKKRIVSVALAFLGLIVIGLAILSFLDFFKPQDAGLLIEANPQSIVYIDNKEVGATPYEVVRKSGEVIVRIKPVSKYQLNFDDYETRVNLISGIKTIIKRNFEENDDYSSGSIVSFEKIGARESYVTVVSIPDNAVVLIDGKVYGSTPLKIPILAGDHNLSVSLEKYLEQKFPIRVYKGYKLTASVKLAKTNETEVTPTASATPEIVKFRIKINKTDVGFLRVRSGSSVGFPEVGQVKPGEIYYVIETGENEKWYKIQMVDLNGEPLVTGWVSADFVTKI